MLCIWESVFDKALEMWPLNKIIWKERLVSFLVSAFMMQISETCFCLIVQYEFATFEQLQTKFPFLFSFIFEINTSRRVPKIVGLMKLIFPFKCGLNFYHLSVSMYLKCYLHAILPFRDYNPYLIFIYVILLYWC